MLIPATTGIPLSYVIRRRALPDPAIVQPIHAHYVANAPLVGDTFDQDSQRVYTLLLTFLTKYAECKTTIWTSTQDNGRIAFETLVTRFEGTGALAHDLIDAEATIKALYYSGEKPPKMDWDKFKKIWNMLMQL